MINITIKQALATSPSQPLYCQVTKEDCIQVQKTNYVSVTKQQCGDVPDHFCVDIQEKTCQISQKPVITACASTIIVVYFNVSVVLLKIKWPPVPGWQVVWKEQTFIAEDCNSLKLKILKFTKSKYHR